MLLVPADHPSARCRSASLDDIAELPLIGSHACSASRAAEATLTAAGDMPEVGFRSGDNGTVQGLVAAGFGAAFVPLLTVHQADERVRVVRLEPAIPRRQIAVVWHRDRHRSPAARAFVEIAAEVSAEVEADLVEP